MKEAHIQILGKNNFEFHYIIKSKNDLDKIKFFINNLEI